MEDEGSSDEGNGPGIGMRINAQSGKQKRKLKRKDKKKNKGRKITLTDAEKHQEELRRRYAKDPNAGQFSGPGADFMVGSMRCSLPEGTKRELDRKKGKIHIFILLICKRNKATNLNTFHQSHKFT